MKDSEDGKDSEGCRGEEICVNQQMLMFVRAGDALGLRRVIENGCYDWLGGGESQSEDPAVNPVLAALLSVHGSACVEEFDAVLGDVRHWSFGRWKCLHWAAASKNESGLVWALSGHAKRKVSLIDKEMPSEDHPHAVCLSALALATQTGDRVWLARVLEIAAECGEDVSSLVVRDRESSVSALGVALFECAQDARQDASKTKRQESSACAEMLFALGFPVDSMKSRGGKMCVALALANPEQTTANHRLKEVAQRALDMGSGSWKTHRPTGLYEAAGLSLDVDWARALDLCGLLESKSNSFALGASKHMLYDLRGSAVGTWEAWARSGRAEDISRRVAVSMKCAPMMLEESPLGGAEMKVMRWMIEESKKTSHKYESVGAFKESIELGIVSAQGTAVEWGAKGGLRL